jgi:hypothetical protein
MYEDSTRAVCCSMGVGYRTQCTYVQQYECSAIGEMPSELRMIAAPRIGQGHLCEAHTEKQFRDVCQWTSIDLAREIQVVANNA